MSDEIIKVLDALAERFGIAVNWTSENVLPYLEQLCGKYVNYEIATSVVWMILGLLLCIVEVVCYKIVHKNKDWGVDPDEGAPDNYIVRIFLYFGVIFIFIISMIVIGTQIFDIITCVTFPEKIIIDELKMIQSNMN